MASFSSYLLPYYLCLLLSICPFISSITIPLSHFHPNQNPFTDPYQKLNHLVFSSLARAHHLKNPQATPTASDSASASTATPVFTHSYGGYSISLSFGTPPQTLPFVMDTGSDLVWFPCTSRYVCKDCPPRIPTFIPKQSSTSKVVGCLNPKCSWLHHTRIQCLDCDDDAASRNCTQICPPYLILYGSGTTGGIALSENLDLPNQTVPNFLIGCSVLSSRQPAGIAGFGRGPTSLPSQLGLSKFSFCLLSRHFDDTSRSTSLILDGESDSGDKTPELSYTPFVKNPLPTEKNAFTVYYYVGLRRITVGGRRVKVPYRHLEPGSDGNGGTIIDSGTTFTFMTREVFEPVAAELVSQVKDYKRALDVEALTGLRPCYNVSDSKTVSFPELGFHFKGGADIALPAENYFAVIGDGGAACLTVVTDDVVGEEVAGGPGIILGNFQMQNFHVEYDLRNERLGFKQKSCS